MVAMTEASTEAALRADLVVMKKSTEVALVVVMAVAMVVVMAVALVVVMAAAMVVVMAVVLVVVMVISTEVGSVVDMVMEEVSVVDTVTNRLIIKPGNFN